MSKTRCGVAVLPGKRRVSADSEISGIREFLFRLNGCLKITCGTVGDGEKSREKNRQSRTGQHLRSTQGIYD